LFSVFLEFFPLDNFFWSCEGILTVMAFLHWFHRHERLLLVSLDSCFIKFTFFLYITC
jgi:hypothetical protein